MVVAAQVAFTWAPPLNRVFGTAPLGLTEVLACLGAGAVLPVAVEAEKALVRRRRAS